MEKELVEYIAQNLVNDPERVVVSQRNAGASVVVELHVAPDDMGRVIGKNGRVANAIRSLLRVPSAKRGKKVILEID